MDDSITCPDQELRPLVLDVLQRPPGGSLGGCTARGDEGKAPTAGTLPRTTCHGRRDGGWFAHRDSFAGPAMLLLYCSLWDTDAVLYGSEKAA